MRGVYNNILSLSPLKLKSHAPLHDLDCLHGPAHIAGDVQNVKFVHAARLEGKISCV